MKNSKYFRIISSLFIAAIGFLLVSQNAFASRWTFGQVGYKASGTPDSSKVYWSVPSSITDQELPKTITIDFDVAADAFNEDNEMVNLYIQEADQMPSNWISAPGRYTITVTVPAGTTPMWYHYYIVDSKNDQICGSKYFMLVVSGN